MRVLPVLLVLACLPPMAACGGGGDIDSTGPDLPADPDGDQHGEPDVGAISITSPQDNLLTSRTVVDVTGIVREGGFTEVVVNGTPAPVGADGTFTAQVTLEEGNNEIHAKAGTADAWIVVRCDTTAPVVRVSAPTRGAHVDALAMPEIEVSGSIEDAHGLTSVTVNGAPATVDAQGAFRFLDVSRAYGVHYYLVEAIDNAGNAGGTGFSVLYGEFAPATTPVPDAVVAFAGPSALAAVSAGAEQMLQQVDLEAIALALNPLGGFLGQDVYVDSLTVEHLGLEAAAADGGIDVTATLENLQMGYHIDIVGPWDIYGTAWSERAVLRGVVDAWATENGTIDAALVESAIELEGFGFDVVPTGIEDALFGEMVAGRIEETIQSGVEEQVPARIAEQLAALDLSRELSFQGISLFVDLAPSALEIDRGGISVTADAALYGEDAGSRPPTPGTLRTPSEAPLVTGDGLAASFSDDTLNQILSAAWRAGLLDREVALSTQNGPITARTIVMLFPTLAGLAPDDAQIIATLDPQLPPVARLDENGAQLSIGEVQVQFEAEAPSGRVPLVRLALYVTADLAADFGDGTSVSLSITAYTVSADPVDAPPGFPQGSEFHRVMDSLMEMLGPDLEAPIASLPLPAFGGYSLAGLESNVDGPRADYLTLRCDLVHP